MKATLENLHKMFGAEFEAEVLRIRNPRIAQEVANRRRNTVAP